MKKAIVGFCIACAALSVNASYLYWQVENGDFTEESYDSAALWVSVDGGAYMVAGNVAYVQGGESHAYKSSHDTVTPSTGIGYIANIAGGELGTSSFSYYVELANSSVPVAKSAITTFSGSETPTYVSNADISVSLPTLASVMPFHATSYTAVPEPTSAILMLFGAAMLGLKRKNRSIA